MMNLGLKTVLVKYELGWSRCAAGKQGFISPLGHHQKSIRSRLLNLKDDHTASLETHVG